MAVTASKIDASVLDGTRPNDADLVVNRTVVTGKEFPPQIPRSSIDCVKISVPTTYVDRAVGNRRRRVHYITGFKLPAKRPGSGIDGVDIMISASDVDRSVLNRG